jgi:hypothetical protein
LVDVLNSRSRKSAKKINKGKGKVCVKMINSGGGRGKAWQRYVLAKTKRWTAPSVVLNELVKKRVYWQKPGNMNIMKNRVCGERRSRWLHEGASIIE